MLLIVGLVKEMTIVCNLNGFIYRILNNPNLGGDNSKGHGMVLALHLEKSIKSSRGFIDVFNSSPSPTELFNCLKPIRKELKVNNKNLLNYQIIKSEYIHRNHQK